MILKILKKLRYEFDKFIIFRIIKLWENIFNLDNFT